MKKPVTIQLAIKDELIVDNNVLVPINVFKRMTKHTVPVKLDPEEMGRNLTRDVFHLISDGKLSNAEILQELSDDFACTAFLSSCFVEPNPLDTFPH